MLKIVTHLEWECRVPPSFRRRGESYWTSAELPIPDEWVFMIRTRPALEQCVDARTLLVVTVERLLERRISRQADPSVHTQSVAQLRRSPRVVHSIAARRQRHGAGRM